ncbi:uncharacterized protein LOC126188711 [Schistocerca cancellata]|uniref:uncharacterized protein LOC126188711 n=1 Tax=Schistocerca cancellata TaxID=274614 RepID=UPI0021179F7E|nr:uncharacterized protein LOC126188711 [Schistocerca cancellata]
MSPEHAAACQHCPGPPPPRFLVPPPPRPPFLQEDAEECSEEPLLPYEVCDLAAPVHLEDGSRGLQPLPATTVVAICCSLLLVAVLTATALLWKYRRKIPCKAAGGDHRDGYCAASAGRGGGSGGGAGPTVEYADLTEILPPPRTSAALQQVLLASSPRSRAHIPRNLVQMQAMPQPRPHRRPHDQRAALCPDYQQPSDLYNPVYNEISNSSDEYLPSDRGDDDERDGGDSGSDSGSSEGVRTYCSAEHLSPSPGDEMSDSPPGHESDSGYSHHSSSGQRRPNPAGLY